MTELAEVAYLRLATDDVAAQAAFAGEMIGLQSVAGGDAHDQAWFRSDIRRRTMVFFNAEMGESSVGIAYHHPDGLLRSVERLRSAGVDVQEQDRATCDTLFVRIAFRTRDPSGNVIDLVQGPHHAGRRFFPARDNGIVGMESVRLRSIGADADSRFWTQMLGFEIRDWSAAICYLGSDDLHHRIVLYPSERKGILGVNFAVEDFEQVMINKYFMNDHQVRVAHGPGRDAAAGQVFLQVHGPDGLIYGLVAETSRINPDRHRPRQFAAGNSALCTWGSRPQDVPEYSRAESSQGAHHD